MGRLPAARPTPATRPMPITSRRESWASSRLPPAARSSDAIRAFFSDTPERRSVEQLAGERHPQRDRVLEGGVVEGHLAAVCAVDRGAVVVEIEAVALRDAQAVEYPAAERQSDAVDVGVDAARILDLLDAARSGAAGAVARLRAIEGVVEARVAAFADAELRAEDHAEIVGAIIHGAVRAEGQGYDVLEVARDVGEDEVVILRVAGLEE